MKKRLLIIALAIVLIVAVGYLAFRFAVTYVFDEYILGTTLSAVANQETKKTEESQQTAAEPDQTQSESENEQESDGTTTSNGKKRLSNSEIISRVLRSSDLTYKMASMVPYEDKQRVIQIVLSNFTADELTEIAKTVANGLTPEYKSKMISIARSRLTSAQWQECLSLAYKYVDMIRPYVE